MREEVTEGCYGCYVIEPGIGIMIILPRMGQLYAFDIPRVHCIRELSRLLLQIMTAQVMSSFHINISETVCLINL